VPVAAPGGGLGVLATGAEGKAGILPLQRSRGILGVAAPDVRFATGGVPDDPDKDGTTAVPVAAPGGGLGVLATGAEGKAGILPLQRSRGVLGVAAPDVRFATGGVPDDPDKDGTTAVPVAAPGVVKPAAVSAVAVPVPPGAKALSSGRGALAVAALAALRGRDAIPAPNIHAPAWRPAILDGPGIALAAPRRPSVPTEAPPYAAAMQAVAPPPNGKWVPRLEIINKAEGMKASRGPDRMEGGSPVMQIILEQIEGALAANLGRGVGPLNAVLGLQRQGR